MADLTPEQLDYQLDVCASATRDLLSDLAAARKPGRITLTIEEWALCNEAVASGKSGSPAHFVAGEIRRRMKEALHGK